MCAGSTQVALDRLDNPVPATTMAPVQKRAVKDGADAEPKTKAAKAAAKRAAREPTPATPTDDNAAAPGTPLMNAQIAKDFHNKLNYFGVSDSEETKAEKKLALDTYKKANPEQKHAALTMFIENQRSTHWVGSWLKTTTETRELENTKIEDWMTKTAPLCCL